MRTTEIDLTNDDGIKAFVNASYDDRTEAWTQFLQGAPSMEQCGTVLAGLRKHGIETRPGQPPQLKPYVAHYVQKLMAAEQRGTAPPLGIL